MRLFKRLLCLGVSLACSSSHAYAQTPFHFADDFGRAAPGSAGEPQWDAQHIGFRVQDGALLAEIPDSGRAVLHAAPLGRAVTLEATVTVREVLSAQWKTAGIGLYLNERNYWHLAFVEAPEAEHKRHFLELSEMLEGNWNAHGEAATKLTTVEETGPFEWRTGQPYRLKLTLARDGDRSKITGEVFENVTPRYRCVRLLDNRAVDRGRPMLVAGGMAALFDDVRVDVAEPVADAPAATLKPPPFVSSPPAQGKNRRATGFFRTEADGETWWLIDPSGHPFTDIGTDHVNYNSHFCEKLGYSPYHRNVEAKFGSPEAWAKDATRRLREWNFNVLGAGNSPQTHYQGLAHTEFLSFGADFSSLAALVPKTTWTGWPDVFDPRFERFCDLRARQRCDPNRADPWLLGYFLDNELEWWGKSGHQWGMAEDACKLPASAPGKKALAASLRAFYKDNIAAFNADFGAQLGNLDALLTLAQLPAPQTDRAKAALAGFIGEAATRYFQVTTAATRKHDPNHLILACRFAHDAPDAAWQQAGATCDVVTVNVYPRINLDSERTLGLEEHLKKHFALCRKPIILTEWSFPALDAKDTEGRPLPSRHGAGMRVDTQEQRARCYAIMQRTLFALPFVVGSHYFMWGDEPALGISSTFPEDSNYGLVSETDRPYPALTATAARVNAQMMALHAGRLKIADVPAGPNTQPAAAPLPVAAGSEVKFERAANGYTVNTGALRLVKDTDGGAAFDHIFWHGAGDEWLELGSYRALLYIVAANQNNWAATERVTDVQVHEQTPKQLVLEISFARDAAPAWKAAYRLTFEAGRPWFKAQGLWVENAGETPWQLRGYFHYAPSRLGGDASDDEAGGPAVPNYWLNLGAWRDPTLGLQYGALPLRDDERISVNFWKDTAQHPDCWRKTEVDLKPNQRWHADPDEPVVALFGVRETPETPRPWLSLTAALRRQNQ